MPLCLQYYSPHREARTSSNPLENYFILTCCLLELELGGGELSGKCLTDKGVACFRCLSFPLRSIHNLLPLRAGGLCCSKS